MRIPAIVGLVLGSVVLVAAPAAAQRLPFERSFDLSGTPKLDVSTIRGKIDITSGDAGRVVVSGSVTVRIGWDVPANAVELARKVADTPPIEREGNTIKLRPPSDAAEQRAVTVAYQIRVPRETEILTVSDSGATTVRGIAGPVTVRTQSGTIDVGDLGSTVAITTGSGAVTVDGAQGELTVSTSSSGFTGQALAGNVRVHTQSGTVDATMTGSGNADVQTGSSAIRLRGVQGALNVRTQSGRVDVDGVPIGPWDVVTGSSSIAIGIASSNGFSLEAESGSGSVAIEGASVDGSITKRRATGTIGGGGPLVRSTTRSGAIRLTVRPGSDRGQTGV